MTNAAQRKIARERRRRREERFDRIISILADTLKFVVLMVCSTLFAGVLVFIVEGNTQRFAAMFEVIATCLFAIWLDYKLFIKGHDE